jgi:hypothetical protein
MSSPAVSLANMTSMANRCGSAPTGGEASVETRSVTWSSSVGTDPFPVTAAGRVARWAGALAG